MPRQKLPDPHEHFQPLVDAALDEWAPAADVRFKSMQQGHSGAAVLRMDLLDSIDSGIPRGTYVLKLANAPLWPRDMEEADAHKRAQTWADSFGDAHVPSLVKWYRESEGEREGATAILVQVGGHSLDSYAPASGRESAYFARVSSPLSTALLRHWTQDGPASEEATGAQLLREWLGYRLDAEQAGPLHERVHSKTLGSPLFVQGSEVLVDPLSLPGLLDEAETEPRLWFPGLLHGDLHGGNILVRRNERAREDYWLIDFAESKAGPALYDHAYLEVGALVDSLRGSSSQRLFTAVVAADRGGTDFPVGTTWWAREAGKIRQAITDWRPQQWPDEKSRQWLLARVAAGVNWANKPLGEEGQTLALAYAGWAARCYLERAEQELWDELGAAGIAPAGGGVRHVLTDEEAAIEQASQELWLQVQDLAGNFSLSNGRYVLVTEALDPALPLAALGQIPWSAVIDLDPDSSTSGLHAQASDVLRTRRGLHEFDMKIPSVDYSRGTAWMMAGGWALLSQAPLSYDDWLFKRLSVIRSFIRNICAATEDHPLTFVFLPGASFDPTQPMARLSKILDASFEISHGRATMLLLGNQRPTVGVRTCESLALGVDEFVHHLERVYGAGASGIQAQIPSGPDGEMSSIPTDRLRAMQENFEVLHSRVLDEPPEEDNFALDEFWRGRPPTWADFDAGTDIARAVCPSLKAELTNRLKENRNQTVVLNHNPGAGGTTAAMRVAWDLHWTYPTAVLKKTTLSLPDRLRNLFEIAGLPVLLVADSAELPESEREELHRALAQFNSRVVVLYLRRTLVDEPEKLGPFSVLDPLDGPESQRFYKAYSSIANEPRRVAELRKITDDPELEKYRTPFFYGLITFEREFIPVTSYVEQHLGTIPAKHRDILEYMALITIYSNASLPLLTLLRLLGYKNPRRLTIQEVFGEGPARLMSVSRSGVRFMHQVLAEEVLTASRGVPKRDWKRDLAHMSQHFIEDLIRVSRADSEPILAMLRQMFVDRPGVGAEDDRPNFSPLIEQIDDTDNALGMRVFEALTDHFIDPHFWTHAGRHHIYRMRDEGLELGEECIQRAIALSPGDSIHWHVLGLARRAKLYRLIRDRSLASAESIHDAGDDIFAGAAEAFTKTRSLSPDNLHGYITHVQMIIQVAEQMKAVTDSASISQVGEATSPAVLWLQEQISLAESLLSDARHLYGTLDHHDRFVTECLADLRSLYGNLDEVVRTWELALARGATSAHSRRALAKAYLVRSNRNWSELSEIELRRVVQLSEQNLQRGRPNNEDYRLWFEAYKHLPEFDVHEAIGRLKIWTSRGFSRQAWRASYYLYVLRFHQWFAGATDSTNEMEEALDACKDLHVGRRGSSYLWLGTGDGPFPVVSAMDLGEWDKSKRFWKNAEHLRRINGVIDREIAGPQAGHIVIDGRIRAFFVPGDRFSKSLDENKPVNFNIGFSAEGLRAWQVERGHVEGGHRRRAIDAPIIKPTVSPQKPASPAALSEQARALEYRQVYGLVDDILCARADLGVAITLEDLRGRTGAILGRQIPPNMITASALEDMDYVIRAEHGLTLVGLADTRAREEYDLGTHEEVGVIASVFRDRGFGFIAGSNGLSHYFRLPSAKQGTSQDEYQERRLVVFTPEKGPDGPRARAIRFIEKTTRFRIRPSRVQAWRERVEEQAIEMSEAARESGGRLNLSALRRGLIKQCRREDVLLVMLSVPKLTPFIRQIDGIRIHGRYPDEYVTYDATAVRAFGRLDPDTDEAPALDAVAEEARAFLASKPAKGIPVGKFLGHLEKKFPGRAKLTKRLGRHSVRALIDALPDIEHSKEGKVALAPSARPRSIPKKKSATTSPSPTKTGGFKEVRAEATKAAAKLLGEAPEGAMSGPELGQQLSALLDGSGSIASRLGVKNLSAFLKGCPEFVIDIEGTSLMVRLAGAASGGHSAADAVKREPGGEGTAAQRAVSEALNMIRASEGGFVTGVALGHHLAGVLKGEGPLGPRLGVSSMRKFLEGRSEFDLRVEGAAMWVSEAGSLVEWPAAPEPPVTDADAPDLAHILKTARKLLLANGGSMDGSSLGTRLAAEYRSDGPVHKPLGYKTLKTLLAEARWPEFDAHPSGWLVRVREKT